MRCAFVSVRLKSRCKCTRLSNSSPAAPICMSPAFGSRTPCPPQGEPGKCWPRSSPAQPGRSPQRSLQLSAPLNVQMQRVVLRDAPDGDAVSRSGLAEMLLSFYKAPRLDAPPPSPFASGRVEHGRDPAAQPAHVRTQAAQSYQHLSPSCPNRRHRSPPISRRSGRGRIDRSMDRNGG